MAQVPTASSTIQRMQNLQTEVAQSVGKDTDACVQKINALKTLILAEYAVLLEEEQKKEPARKICEQLQASLVSNVLPRPEQPKAFAQKLYEFAHDRESKCRFHRIEQKENVEAFYSSSVEAARISHAGICNSNVQRLIRLGTQIAQDLESVRPLPNAEVSPSNPAASRERRIEIYRAENFASEPAVLRLDHYCQRLMNLFLKPDLSLSPEQRVHEMRILKEAIYADAVHVDDQMASVAEQIRSIMGRYDAFATFYDKCITNMWIIRTAIRFYFKLDDLLIQERALAQQMAQEPPPAPEVILLETKKLKGIYEQIKTEAAKLPQFPSLSQYYSYADSLGRPTTVDKAAPEFENIKVDAITKEQKNAWATLKACIVPAPLCSDILDERIGYLSKLLAKQPDNADLQKLLQTDMEERLNLFIADIANLGTPLVPADVNNLLAKGEELKKGLPYTNQADRFNHVIIQLLAKQAALHTAEYAAQFPAKMAELKQLSEPLKTQIAASRTPEKAKPVLTQDEVAALESQHRGLDKPATFEGQMKRLVDLKYGSLPYLGGEKAWVAEALKRCYYSEAQAKTQEPLLTRKLNQQYAALATEFDKQRTALTSQAEWVTLNDQIRNEIAKPLNITEDAIRAKGYDPKAATMQAENPNMFGRLVEKAAMAARYCTRYTQWWDNGPSHAPKPAVAPASPASSSPESSTVAVPVAPAASGAPGSPAASEPVVAAAASGADGSSVK